MSKLVLPSRRASSPYPSLFPVEQQTSAAPTALSPGTLEHGAYYAGKLGAVPAVARWHAKKRSFVFREFILGRECIRSIPHVADAGTGERFIPLSKTEPKNAQHISDYAFETVG